MGEVVNDVQKLNSQGTPPAGMPRIKLENLNKTFHTRRQTIYAVKDCNIEVEEGDFVSIIGPSGCGKSTIIRMVDDIIKPTSGKIYVDGDDITAYHRIPKDVNRKFGFIFQQPNLMPWLTVRENVLFPLTMYQMRSKENCGYADELIAMAGLASCADAYPVEISSGAAQRVGVIRALVHKPEILLMDEPFGALDALTRELLDLELLGIWKRMHKTIVFITHNVEEAVLLSKRVYVMATNPGRVIQEVKVGLPYPRTLDLVAAPEFQAYCTQLTDLIGHVDLSKIK